MGCAASALFPFLPEYSFEGEGAAARSIAKIEKNGHFIVFIITSIMLDKNFTSWLGIVLLWANMLGQ